MFARQIALAGLLVGSATASVAAQDFSVVAERDAFVTMLEGKDLRLGLLGITLVVAPDGTIAGEAMGWPITGTWEWIDGAFCREMDWGGKPIVYNCQLVETRGGRDMRFTVDRGAGESATFRMRDR